MRATLSFDLVGAQRPLDEAIACSGQLRRTPRRPEYLRSRSVRVQSNLSSIRLSRPLDRRIEPDHPGLTVRNAKDRLSRQQSRPDGTFHRPDIQPIARPVPSNRQVLEPGVIGEQSVPGRFWRR